MLRIEQMRNSLVLSNRNGKAQSVHRKKRKNGENRGHVVNLVVHVSCKRGAKSL